jgi:hypothetical protein
MFGVAKVAAGGLSALESAGTAAWQSLEGSAAQGNTWARLITETEGSIGRQDPGLPDFVARLRAAGIRVTNTNVVMYGEAGRDLGEIDVITDNALIQYKNGAGIGPNRAVRHSTRNHVHQRNRARCRANTDGRWIENNDHERLRSLGRHAEVEDAAKRYNRVPFELDSRFDR